MCSISGGFSFEQSGFLDRILLETLIRKGEERGRDSFGFSCPRLGTTQKFICAPSNIFFEIPKRPFVFLNNNRAEPTTEFIKHKTQRDVQPFSHKSITVVHNGTIANDKELYQIYNLPQPSTSIDSAVIPALLYKIWKGSAEHLVEILSQVILGSFALAMFDERNPHTLWLAVNYKPLTLLLCNEPQKNALYFTSLEEFSGIDPLSTKHPFKIVEVKPYTLLKIESSGLIQSFSLYPKKQKKKALIIASGGLDSTVAASWAKHQGYEIELLHFSYGCKASLVEETRIKQIANFLGCELTTINTDFFKTSIKHSRLFEENSLMLEEEGKKSAELAHEWVPARNLIFMSIAAGFAEAYKFDFIILGGNLEESGCLVNIPENQVRMWDYSQKMPKDIQKGDELLGWNEQTFDFEKTIVQKVFTPIHKTSLILEFENDTKIQVSKEHPFYVPSRGWINASNLFVGDILKTQKAVLTIKKITVSLTPVQTYNYHCEPHNNFFINKENILTHNSYPDNEYIFQKKFNELLPFALNLNSQVEVLTPIAHLMKHEIVRLGLELGSPLHLTWSCYSDQEFPCGVCGPDFMRRTAFKMNEVKDMQAQDLDSDFWKNCKTVRLINNLWKKEDE